VTALRRELAGGLIVGGFPFPTLIAFARFAVIENDGLVKKEPTRSFALNRFLYCIVHEQSPKAF